MKKIGKVSAIENKPTTIDEFYFWTRCDLRLNPFDVVKVEHIGDSKTFGVIEEICHITDTPSYLTSYMSNDFGDVDSSPLTRRVGLNYVKAKVIANDEFIYNPVLDGSEVSLAETEEIMYALGLKDVKNKLICGYLEMYEGDEEKVTIPVHLNSAFLIGPEGAHLNISGISGLASKTSYAMFLMKAIQEQYLSNTLDDDSVAFVMLNVKGKDLLAIDEPNIELEEKDKKIYEMLGLEPKPFENVQYYFPYSSRDHKNTYVTEEMQARYDMENNSYKYKFTCESDKNIIDLLFSHIDDSTGTMESICDHISSSEEFSSKNIRSWDELLRKVQENSQSGRASNSSKEILVGSWKKFLRVVKKPLNNPIFNDRIIESEKEVRLEEQIANIKKNEVKVVDISRLDETMQGAVFGSIIQAIYDLKLGTFNERDEKDIPSRIIIFVDELNKYASVDTPKSSSVLKHILDIAERGRSLGIILFSAEQFKSAIKDRVKGNCATHAYGRTNAIEISKQDYKYVPNVYKNMMTRLKQGEYIIQNPVFRSLLNIKFPKPVYKQFKK